MLAGLNATTLLSSAITSAVNGIALFFTIRYLSKVADRVEKIPRMSKMSKKKKVKRK